MIGLYQHIHCVGYDDDGDYDYDELLATDVDADSLIRRWNAFQDAERKKLVDAGKHESYVRLVPPNFPEGKDRLEFEGGNGGGYMSVRHRLTIRPVPQFDQKSPAAS